MKRIFERFHLQIFAVLTAATIVMCARQSPNKNQTEPKEKPVTNAADTIPAIKNDEGEINSRQLDEAMKSLNINLANLNVQMKNLNVDINNEIANSLSKIKFDEINNSIKKIDFDKIQNEINISMKNAQNEIAKVDFSKVQNELKIAQDKLQSEEFKAQINSEKLQQQVNDAMSKAKDGIEKAKQKLQRIKDFTDELAADNLIDKKKGYTIEWKSGSLFINGKEQSKEISDKYRKYDDAGKIKMLPDDAEHF